MRMRPDEKCIIPGCRSIGGAKPIYIQVTVGGRRTWRKIGALCKYHVGRANRDRLIESAGVEP